ncbi:hypothetical protein BC829DRAFT_441161 [Chytridium lagenaria]|nr:hypothetical protein BC829DRAFT_441161 [Chytridium lagenaria]
MSSTRGFGQAASKASRLFTRPIKSHAPVSATFTSLPKTTSARFQGAPSTSTFTDLPSFASFMHTSSASSNSSVPGTTFGRDSVMISKPGVPSNVSPLFALRANLAMMLSVGNLGDDGV